MWTDRKNTHDDTAYCCCSLLAILWSSEIKKKWSRLSIFNLSFFLYFWTNFLNYYLFYFYFLPPGTYIQKHDDTFVHRNDIQFLYKKLSIHVTIQYKLNTLFVYTKWSNDFCTKVKNLVLEWRCIEILIELFYCLAPVRVHLRSFMSMYILATNCFLLTLLITQETIKFFLTIICFHIFSKNGSSILTTRWSHVVMKNVNYFLFFIESPASSSFGAWGLLEIVWPSTERCIPLFDTQTTFVRFHCSS